MTYAGLSRKSCSQNLRTFQPSFLRCRLLRLSLLLVPLILFTQKSLFDFGIVLHLAHPCQKQPSTNRAIRCLRKTKSGLPNTSVFRNVHPVRPAATSLARSAFSVERLPLLNTLDMILERCALVRLSDIYEIIYL